MKKLLVSLLCAMMCFANITMIEAESTTDALDTLIQQAEVLDEEFYSVDSYIALEDQLKVAKALDSSAEQSVIDQAVIDLQSVVDALQPRYVNLALNKTVVASSTLAGDANVVEHATDGNFETSWNNNYNSAAYTGGNRRETLTVDLGDVYAVDAVRLFWTTAYATDYIIQGSVDGVEYVDYYTMANSSGGEQIHYDFGDPEIRYVRLVFNETRLQAKGYQVVEFEVYEKNPYYSVYENIAEGKDFEVSSSYVGDMFSASHLVDGDRNTRWGSDYSTASARSEEYAIIDLGAVYDVDRLQIFFETACPSKYSIQTSEDGVTYTDIYTDLVGAVGLQRFVEINKQARYVKILMKEAATKYGYSIFEIEVYRDRKLDLQEYIASYENELNKVEVGNEAGMMSEADYNAFMTILNEAKAVASGEPYNVEISNTIAILEKTSESFEDTIIGGSVYASIYPVPQYQQSISSSGMLLSETIDVVVHGEQDVATLPKLTAILEAAGYNMQVVEAKGENSNLTLAINCGDEACELCNVADPHSVLSEEQAYILTTEDGNISIVASDADGAYYGVMSLAQILEQKTDANRIAEVTVSDYPDVPFRGYVEGFYGIPWTFDDRAKLFEDTTKYKMTTYIYAPKDDPYHRGKWRDLYPEDKAEEMSQLAEIATANNMEFCWTIHPGADYNYTTDSDGDGLADDYEVLLEKFEQVYSFGVRQFGIFYDDLDYSVANGTNHAKVINDAYAYMTSKYDDVKPMITVVTRYTNSWGADWNTYFKPFMQDIHEDTIVLWTGQSTMSAITKAYMEVPKTKTGIDRDYGVWWNYPVTDYLFGHLFMGSLDCLSTDVDNIVSFFLNPMSEADASKVAIYSGADYSWNTKAFDSTESWKRAIKELVPDANEAFERFADNLARIDKGNGFVFDESKYLKNDLTAFSAALEDGYQDGDGDVLKAHYVQMVEDAQLLYNIQDPELKEEIAPFVQAYEALAKAGVAIMEAFECAYNGDVQTALAKQTEAEEFLAQSESYSIKTLDGTAKVSVGDYRLRPFLTDVKNDIFSAISGNVKPNVPVRMITNVDLLNTKDVETTDITYTLKDVTASMKQDDYIGIALPEAMHVYSVDAEVNSDQLKLQYSLNGIDWIDVPETKTEVLTAAYVRVVALADVDTTISELSVTKAYEPIYTTGSTSQPTYQNYTINYAFDNDLTTNFWSSTGSVEGDYFAVDLGAKAKIGVVELYSGINKYGVVDGFAKTQLQVSEDGKTWTDIGEAKSIDAYEDVDSTMKKLVIDAGQVEGRYFRFKAIGTSDSWAKVYEVKYDVEYLNYVSHLAFESTLTLTENSTAANMMDGNMQSYAGYNTATVDDEIIIDLGTLMPLYDVDVYFGLESEVVQGFTQVKLSTSTDKATWVDGTSVSSDAYETVSGLSKATLSANGTLARYILFKAVDVNDAPIKVYEVKYNTQISANTGINAVTTNMETYKTYKIANAYDKQLDTKFYSSHEIRLNDYIQVDLGISKVLNDTSIYFGGDPNDSTSFDGFKQMDVKVSDDASTWTTVTSTNMNEYKVVGDRYVASVDLGGVKARYIQFVATQASTSWLQVYEVQVNNKVDMNKYDYVDKNSTTNISNSHLLFDGSLDTSAYMYEVSADQTLVIPMTSVTNVSTIGVYQAEDYICNAEVTLVGVDGTETNGGTLDKAWTTIDVNAQITEVRFTFNGNVIPTIYEVVVYGDADYARVNQALGLIPEDLSIYTPASVETLNAAKDAVVSDLTIEEQLSVDAYANAMNDAIRGLEELSYADYTEVEKAIEEANAVKANAVDFSAVQAAIDAVVYDLPRASQGEVDAMAQAIRDAIANLTFQVGKVNLQAEAVDYKTIQLTWNEDAYATKYIVERLNTSTNEWIILTETSETTYVAEGVKTGKEYTFRVKAANDAMEAEYSDEVKVTTTLSGEVELSIANNGSDKFDLTWSGVEGATRYIIYRKTADGEWKKVLTLGKDARSYTSSTMLPNTYSYQVKAGRYDSVDRVMTNGSNVVEGIIGAETMNPTNLVITQDENGVTFTWDKVAGMPFYEVYRSKNGGVFRHMKNTTTTSITTSSLKSGTYQYKLRAYTLVNGEKVYSQEVVSETFTIE